MLKSNCFYDFPCFQAFYADPDLSGRAVYHNADSLKVGRECPRGYAGYLLADSALTLGEAAAHNASSGNGFFTAYFAGS